MQISLYTCGQLQYGEKIYEIFEGGLFQSTGVQISDSHAAICRKPYYKNAILKADLRTLICWI